MCATPINTLFLIILFPIVKPKMYSSLASQIAWLLRNFPGKMKVDVSGKLIASKAFSVVPKLRITGGFAVRGVSRPSPKFLPLAKTSQIPNSLCEI